MVSKSLDSRFWMVYRSLSFSSSRYFYLTDDVIQIDIYSICLFNSIKKTQKLNYHVDHHKYKLSYKY